MTLDPKDLAKKYGQVYLRLDTEDMDLLQEALTKHAPEVGKRLFDKLADDYGDEWRQVVLDNAERLYDNDDVDIDQNALFSRSDDDGFFVQAWVFVRDTEILPGHPDYPYRPEDYEEPDVIDTIAGVLEANDSLHVQKAGGYQIVVGCAGNKYVVTVGDSSDEPDAKKDGTTLDPEKHKAPEKVTDHVTLLSACLNALARSPHRERISNLTTDGDGKDCEAIFDHTDEGTLILKVR